MPASTLARTPSNCLVGEEVDHAADGVRAVRRRSAARHDVDAVDEQLRKLADVRHTRDVGRHDALAIEQGQCANRLQSAQAEGTQPLQTAAGAADVHGAAEAALQCGQLRDRVEQIGHRDLREVGRGQRGGRRRRREPARSNARAGYQDFGEFVCVGCFWLGRVLRMDRRGPDCQRSTNRSRRKPQLPALDDHVLSPVYIAKRDKATYDSANIARLKKTPDPA